MSTAKIEVSYVNAPKPGKKMGNLKLADGTFYLVAPSMLGLFQNGGKYEVEYEESEFGGKTWRTVKKLAGGGNGAVGGSQVRTGAYGATDDKTAERIFVCGGLNAFITSGQVEPNAVSITQAVNALRSAWSGTLGGKGGATSGPQPQVVPATVDDDMNDSIPF